MMKSLKKESSRAQGRRNRDIFREFVRKVNLDNAWDEYVNSKRTRLVRKKIREACGIGKSPFKQNEPLKDELKRLEKELQQNGVLVSDESIVKEGLVLSNNRRDRAQRIASKFAGVEEDAKLVRQLIQSAESKLNQIITGLVS